jgi:hypothetical protein
MGAAAVILDIGDTFDVIGWLIIIAVATVGAARDLRGVSDWSLKDIGIFRQVPGLDAVKPFWMA